MCECTDTSMDLKTPRNVYLSAFYKRSFAYHTVKNRMPIILTQIIDKSSRTKDDIVKEFGEEAKEDIKKVIGELSKYKYEVQTNKPLVKLTSDDPDIKLYNDYIDKQATEEGETTHFNTIWLLTECYMYRRIKVIFSNTNTLQSFDYFRTFKEEQYNQCKSLIKLWADYLVKLLNLAEKKDDAFYVDVFNTLLKADLWGNKCDLSISLGKVDNMNSFETQSLDEFLLVNDIDKFIKHLFKLCYDQRYNFIDIVLDNSGYEIITDLCLMTAFMVFFAQNDANKFKIRFHTKAIPWFISDVTENDFNWVLQQVLNDKDPNCKIVAEKWKEWVENGTWQILGHSFWTSPYEFKFMEEFAPDLHCMLKSSGAVIFKGDLNYRKVFGEKNWDPTTPPGEIIKEIKLDRILVLRTVKADIVVGLPTGVAELCEKKDVKWMENGDYGVIHYVEFSE